MPSPPILSSLSRNPPRVSEISCPQSRRVLADEQQDCPHSVDGKVANSKGMWHCAVSRGPIPVARLFVVIVSIANFTQKTTEDSSLYETGHRWFVHFRPKSCQVAPKPACFRPSYFGPCKQKAHSENYCRAVKRLYKSSTLRYNLVVFWGPYAVGRFFLQDLIDTRPSS